MSFEVSENFTMYSDITIQNCVTNVSDKSEMHAIIELPKNIIKSKVTSLLSMKARKHQEILEQMQLELKKINSKIESFIRIEAENLQIYNANIKYTIQKSIENIKTDDIMNGFKKSLCRLLTNIKNSSTSRQRKISGYLNLLLQMEYERSRLFKSILQNVYQKLYDVAHLLPFELQEFFEDEIFKINTITLNNFHYYNKLEHGMQLQVENDGVLWSHELKKIEENLKHLVNSEDSEIIFDEISEESLVPLTSAEKWKEYFVEMHKRLKFIKNNCKQIVNLYKIVIIRVYNRFFKDLHKVPLILNESAIEIIKEDLDQCITELDYSHSEAQTLEEFEKNCEEIIDKVRSNLENTFEFLKLSCSLWIKHFMRTQSVQSIILKDLKNVTKKNNSKFEISKIKLNISLDALRQSSSEKASLKNYQAVQKVFTFIENLFIQNFEEECKVVAKYRNFLSIESDLHILEIECFLKLHPQDGDFDPKAQKKRRSKMELDELSNENICVPSEVLYCKYLGIAINNWKFGLWEAIKQYLNSCKMETMQKTENWIELQTKILKQKFEFFKKITRTKFHNIKASFYNRRMSELNYHMTRFERHKSGIQNEFEKFKISNSALIENQVRMSGSYKNVINIIETKIEKSIKSQNIVELICELNDFSEKFNSESKKNSSNCTKWCQEFRQNIQVINYQLNKSMIIFLENGNFHPEEKKLFLKIMKTNESILENSIAEMESNIKETWANCLQINYSSTNLLKKLNDIKSVKAEQEKYLVNLKKVQDLLKHEGFSLSFKLENIKKHFKKNIRHSHMIDIKEIINEFLEIKSEIYDFKKYLTHIKFGRAETGDLNSTSYYIARCNNILMKEAETLQKFSGEFMDEILRKFDNYRKQCDLNWLSKCINFESILLDFNNFLNNFSTQYLRNVFNSIMDQVDLKRLNILENIQEQLKLIEELYMDVHGSLKTLHGHPQNKALLLTLEEKHNYIEANNFNKILNSSKDFIIELENEQKKLIMEFKKAQDLLKKFNCNEDLLLMKHEIHTQIEEASYYYKTNDSDFYYSNKHHSDFESYNSESELDLSIVKLCDVNSGSKLQLLETHSYELEENLQSNISQILEKASEESEYHMRFKEMWQADVNRICSLYKVKYDLKKTQESS